MPGQTWRDRDGRGILLDDAMDANDTPTKCLRCGSVPFVYRDDDSGKWDALHICSLMSLRGAWNAPSRADAVNRWNRMNQRDNEVMHE